MCKSLFVVIIKQILGFGDIEHIPTGQRSSEPKMTANVSKMLRTKRKKCYQSR